MDSWVWWVHRGGIVGCEVRDSISRGLEVRGQECVGDPGLFVFFSSEFHLCVQM